MVRVEGNDRLLIEPQARPPALELDLWKPTVPIDGALDHGHDAPQRRSVGNRNHCGGTS